MAVSLEEIDRLIEGGTSRRGGLDEIDRLIGGPPPEEQPSFFTRLLGGVTSGRSRNRRKGSLTRSGHSSSHVDGLTPASRRTS